MKLLEHFRAMQETATRYLIPEPYVDRDGRSGGGPNDPHGRIKDRLFLADMIYMLDGPEQREAQIEAAGLFTDTGFHLPSVNEGLRVARVCNGHPLPGDLPDDEVVVRFKLSPGADRKEFVEYVTSLVTDELSHYTELPEKVIELEVDGVVHLNV